MTETSSFLHPAIWFFGVAALLPVWPRKGWKWMLIAAPVLAIASVLMMTPGEFMPIHYLWGDEPLVLGRVDKLSVVFAHVFAVQALLGFTFALHLKEKYQHIAAASYVGGAFGCVFAGDYLTLFLFWEIMSVASTFLVWLNNTDTSTRAGFRYFLFHTLGGLFLLAGLLLRYGDIGTFAFTHIDPSAAKYYDWLILLGFCVNAAVVPLHAWLPDAYPEGTVTGSVFMSAYTTKTAVYVLARAFASWEILAVMGVVMTLYGVFYATIENNARRILSYHIVSQVGYMVAGIGIGTAMTMNGACAHAYAHILYKGLLFMSAGTILYATGTAKLSELGGLASRMPLVMICYVVAGLSISGMPFFNGFVSKTMTIAGAAEAHHTWLALGMEVAAVGTFLSVGIKLPYFAFWGGKPEDKTRVLKPIPINMYIAMFGGGTLCFLMGVYPEMLYRLLPFPLTGGHGHGIPEVAHTLAAFDVGYVPYTAWNLLQAFMLLGFTGLGFYLMRNIIKPHPSRNLDFDWVYRLAGKLVMWVICIPLAAIDGLWTNVYRAIGLRGLMAFAASAGWFDVKAIDGVVDGTAYTVRGIGRTTAKAQTGRLQDYLALAALLGLGIFAVVWFWA
ncbi:multicomponent Na+:H+ antiporter subunit D [Desulfobaculum xiamenense]|uniref:Multicomponent Na+:H+ antiporter subunit D n=1 Tax=Desulfobaculum xiamenense TaxID=995050 RepID=A0A846QHJ6_9BACT|nr:Na(+)/H(+) antiporter subunit D [Desulfobaculum xiamenense]NJB67681.1 multicomponent Na+:H+ antiporter subunit D [Desulfobaculum xiamenense]